MDAYPNSINRHIPISGYIRVHDRDKSGHIIQVALETDEMDKYIIESNEKGNDLTNFIDKRVLIIGTVLHQDYMDHEIIIVDKFNVIIS